MPAQEANGPRERLPRITVITPSYNQGRYIRQTIESVLDQDYPDVEHIVMDGGSTDETVDILRTYPHLTWRSEKDRGQADALNKGLALSTGEIVGWVNSDDYYHPKIFASVARHFSESGARWVTGRLANVYAGSQVIRFRTSPPVSRDALFRDPDIVRQQATFFLRSELEAVGGWNVDKFMVMDLDLWVRLAARSAPLMVNEDWAYFRNHPAQKSGHSNILRQSREITELFLRAGAPKQHIARNALKKRWYWCKGLLKEQLLNWGIVPEKYRGRAVRE